MGRYVAYLSYIVRHKWFVAIECCRLNIPWRGIIHDLSKFRLDEFVPYARYFYNRDGTAIQRRDDTGYYKPTNTGDQAFDFAWLLHQKRNRHHWQWWVLPEDEGRVKILEMSDVARREMLADWRGAGRAQGTPYTAVWYQVNKHKMCLGPETRQWIEERLDDD